MGKAAADGAGVRFHRPEGKAAAGKNPVVGLMHLFVGRVRPILGGVKAVAVLHDELSAAHQAEAGPDLIPELGLDLVEIQGKFLVGVDIEADQVGDHLFVRGSEAAFPAVPVGEAQQLGAILFPAPGFLPEIPRLHHGQEQLLGSGPVHLLADDALDLADRGKAQGQVGVNAGGEFADESGAEQQLVADHLGLGGGFFQGGDEQLGKTHGAPGKQLWIMVYRSLGTKKYEALAKCFIVLRQAQHERKKL